jgi:hypothetical protein
MEHIEMSKNFLLKETALSFNVVEIEYLIMLLSFSSKLPEETKKLLAVFSDEVRDGLQKKMMDAVRGVMKEFFTGPS